jgi:hypothetical protein
MAKFFYHCYFNNVNRYFSYTTGYNYGITCEMNNKIQTVASPANFTRSERGHYPYVG